MTVVVSILGLGRWDKEKERYVYETARYRWDDREVVETSLIQDAFAKWFPDAEFLILATEKAEQERERDLERIPNKQVVRIKEGRNPVEFWEIYNALTDNLKPGSEVILDVTHGFRSLGMLAFLAIVFLQAAKRVKLLYLLYGAQEAKGADGTTPIFDLSPFVTMLDWASATNRFLETGYPQKLADLAEIHSENLAAYQHLKAFSRHIQLHDPIGAGKEAQKAVEALNRVSQGPMGVLNQLLIDRLSPLAFTEQDDEEKQLIAMWFQIEWYLQHQHYEKAVGFANEWIHLFGRWKSSMSIYDRDHKFSMKKFIEKLPDSEAKKDLKEIHDKLSKLRNKMMHWSFASAIDENLEEIEALLQKLRGVVEKLCLKLPRRGQ